jgi:TRAP-type C4-dicarboxylate transport system permease small subunit
LFDNTLSHLAVLAMIWMVAMPGLVSFAKYLAHKPPSQSI